MNKANSIRRKALEHAKKREWDKALKEYMRLAELEGHNPNVFNELGDLHLKIGNKREAFESFHSAIDAYSSVQLHNNAVAVCKKIIRLNSKDHSVYGKLATLRNQQGFKKEAATYGIMFLDRVVQDPKINPDDLRERLNDLVSEMDHSPEVMERVADYLLKAEFKEDAGRVLAVLAQTYASMGMTTQSQEARKKMAAIGYTGGEDVAAATEEVVASPPVAETETGYDRSEVELPGFEDTATESVAETKVEHSRGDIELPGFGDPTTESKQPVGVASAADDGKSSDGVYDFGSVELDDVAPATMGSPQTAEAAPDEGATAPAAHGEMSSMSSQSVVTPPPPAGDSTPRVPESPRPSGPPRDVGSDEIWLPNEELPDTLRKDEGEAAGEFVGVKEIIDQFSTEVRANIDEDDHRSHYDLGMAYLEMDLLPEAIREFQFAANSESYHVRSLEMIGLCFLKQNQPRLAIRQLEKGLSLVGNGGERESMGLRYNLGLAYETIGEFENAKKHFEDVYIVDVGFRDVAQKLKKFGA